MNKIYLVQHGAAASKEVDPERPLTGTGTQAVQAMARFLRDSGVQPAAILHSGKLRAQQSADILARVLLSGAPATVVDHINPGDSAQAFAASLDRFANGTMFVGHLPFMEKLVALLLSGSESTTLVQFTPGSVACLAAAGQDWRLEWMLRPELLQ